MKRRLAITNIELIASVLAALAVIIAVLAVVRFDTTGQKGSGLGKEFLYDIEELGKIDPNLILYDQLPQHIDTQFQAALAIAVGPGGHIYAAGDKAIRIFNESGDLLSEIKLPDAPRCLTVSGDDKIYLGMKDHVQVYDQQGQRLARWQSLGSDAVLTSIAVSENNVFVADAGNRIVLHYDTAGNLINQIGKKNKDKNIPGFVIPSPYFDLTLARDGLLRVVNPGRRRIEAYTFAGDLEFTWGKFSNTDIKGFCGCCNPVNFAILDDESFVTCEKGLIRVKIYDPDGNFVGVVAGPKQLVKGGTSRICYYPADCQTGGFDVAVDQQGRILVLDTIKNVIRIFTKKN